MAPAGKPNVGAILGEGQGAAGMSAVAMHRDGSFSRQAALRRCLTENGQRGKREVGERERLVESCCDRPDPAQARGNRGAWVLLPKRVKFIVTSCAKAVYHVGTALIWGNGL
jgi:hypothetical protein